MSLYKKIRKLRHRKKLNVFCRALAGKIIDFFHAVLDIPPHEKEDCLMKRTLGLFLLCCANFHLLSAQSVPRSELIFPWQEKHVHGSSIVECPNGDLLACWFYGSGERSANDVLIQGARLRKGSSQWSSVFTMADTPNLPDCNPVLFIDLKHRLWMFWIAVLANRWECSLLRYRISEDYQKDDAPHWSWQDVIILKPGAEFSAAVEKAFASMNFPEGLWAEYALPYSKMIIESSKDLAKQQSGWMTRIHPLVLPSNRILLPLYSDGFNVSLAAISDDEGKTWKASLPIVGLGPIQPTFVRKKDGTLIAYLRDSGDAPNRVMQSASVDEGYTWSIATDTEIPNPGSSLEVIALNDGRWVMVFNDTEHGRHRLSLALSDDEGATWKWKRELENDGSGKAGFAYPSIVQARDGSLHMTYSYHTAQGRSIKHVAVDAEWIKGGKETKQ